MRLPDFKVEQWMNDYEGQAVYNLTDTCSKSLTMQELMDLASIDFSELTLDYGQITGDVELKEEILKLYTTGTIDNITTCHGCLEANELVMNTLLEPGDHVITFVPGYQQFYDVPKSLGCQVTCIAFDEAMGWKFDMVTLQEAIQTNTKMLILNNPSNPTGVTFEADELEAIVSLCQENDMYILCDEVYRGFGNDASISDLYDKGIATSSLSKVYALAGLRFGWMKANLDVIHQINVRRDYTMISTGPMIDAFSKHALIHKEEILERNAKMIEANRQIVKDWLQENPMFHVVLPKSGTVSFMKYDFDMKSEELAKRLLEETGVFFVPGSCFDCESHLRLGLGQSSASMEKGLSVLSQWVKENIG